MLWLVSFWYTYNYFTYKTGQSPEACNNGDVKLWRPNGGIGAQYFGLALFCKNNKWTGVCDDSFTCHTARLFCQQLGFPGAFSKLIIITIVLIPTIRY